MADPRQMAEETREARARGRGRRAGDQAAQNPNQGPPGVNPIFTNPMLGAGQSPYGVAAPPPRPQPQGMFPAGSVPNTLNNFLLGGYLTAPQNLAAGVNNAFDRYQYYADRAGTRNVIRDAISALLSGRSNQGGNQNRLSGFQDTGSINRAGGGSVTSGVTMQPLSAGQVGAAVGQVANAPPPKVSGQYAGPDAAGLNSHLANLTRTASADNAMNVERQAAVENAGLARTAEVARAEDELAKLRWLLGRDVADTRHQVAMDNNNLRAAAPLMQLLMGGLA